MEIFIAVVLCIACADAIALGGIRIVARALRAYEDRAH
jgi:hypothetical protein